MWPITTENKCFVKMLYHFLCECVKVTVLFSLFNMYCSSLHWPFFLVISLCSFFFNIYMSWHIYYYTDTTNFIIFSQLLRCQFLISQNKIIKYEIVTNHKSTTKNKCFVKMLWHLLLSQYLHNCWDLSFL